MQVKFIGFSISQVDSAEIQKTELRKQANQPSFFALMYRGFFLCVKHREYPGYYPEQHKRHIKDADCASRYLTEINLT